MPFVELVLQYRMQVNSKGRQADAVVVGRSAARHLLRAMREELLAQARGETDTWARVDEGVCARRVAEARQLEEVLDALVPDDAPGAVKKALDMVLPDEEARRSRAEATTERLRRLNEKEEVQRRLREEEEARRRAKNIAERLPRVQEERKRLGRL